MSQMLNSFLLTVKVTVANTWSALQTFSAGIQMEGGLQFNSFMSKTFEHFFSGDSIDVIWTQTVINSCAFAMEDGIDDGVSLTTGTTLNDGGSLNFNNLRHFDAANCTIYGIFKAAQTTLFGSFAGVQDATSPTADGNKITCATDTSNSDFIALLSGDGGVGTTFSDSDVATSTSLVPFKIVSDGTDMKLFLLVSGIWTLKVTKTTDLATGAVQPFFGVTNRTGAAKATTITYLRIKNGS